jgi:hypothetical protein
MHLTNGRSTGNVSYMEKKTTSWVMVASRPEVRSSLDGNNSPGNYGCLVHTVWRITVVI